MENIYKCTIPWVWFSQLEVRGSFDDFITSTQEIANRLNEIPEIFFVKFSWEEKPSQSKEILARLQKANDAIIALQKTHPEIKATLLKIKEW